MEDTFNPLTRDFAKALFQEHAWLRRYARLETAQHATPGSMILTVGVPPLRPHCAFYLSTDEDEITVGFGMYHTHIAWPPDPELPWWNDPLQWIQRLMDERVVIEDWTKAGQWTGSSALESGEAVDVSAMEPDHVVFLRSWTGRKDRILCYGDQV